MIIQKLPYDNKVAMKKGGFLLSEVIIGLAVFMIIASLSTHIFHQLIQVQKSLHARLYLTLHAYSQACAFLLGVPPEHAPEYTVCFSRLKEGTRVEVINADQQRAAFLVRGVFR